MAARINDPDNPEPSAAFKIYENVRGFSLAVKDAGRVREIVSVLVRHGFGALIGRLKLGDDAKVEKSDIEEGDRVRQDAIPVGVRLRRALEELGPTFIKFGQILSTRPDIVPADVLVELERLQDDVPDFSWDEAKLQIETSLGKPYGEVFAQIEQNALASASVAQVHRAILNSGEEVVVKIQRPGIRRQIEADLHILYWLARKVEQLVPELELVDAVGVIYEFEKAITREIDFRNERDHIDVFRHNFANFKGVLIPKVYKEYTSRDVITLEYIRGFKITEGAQRFELDPYEMAPIMMRLLFKMIFKDGYFHGDLHPGNILIQPDGTIGLIDFGLVGSLNERQRDHILDIMIGISRQDYALVARVFYELGVKVPGVRYDYRAFESDVVELMEHHIGAKNISDIEIGAFFSDIAVGALRHRIKMPPTYTMVFKAIMTVEGLGKNVAPEINFLDQLRPFIRDVLIERYSPKRLLREGFELIGGASRVMRELPILGMQVVEETARGNLQFRIQNREDDRVLDMEHHRNASIVRSAGLFTMTLCGTLAWEFGVSRVLGMSVPSFIFFSLALVFGLPLVFRALTGRF